MISLNTKKYVPIRILTDGTCLRVVDAEGNDYHACSVELSFPPNEPQTATIVFYCPAIEPYQERPDAE